MERLGRGQRGTARKRAHDVPVFVAGTTPKAVEVEEVEELELGVLEPGYIVRDGKLARVEELERGVLERGYIVRGGKRTRVVVRFGPTIVSRPDRAQVVADPNDGAELVVLRDGTSQRIGRRQICAICPAPGSDYLEFAKCHLHDTPVGLWTK